MADRTVVAVGTTTVLLDAEVEVVAMVAVVPVTEVCHLMVVCDSILLLLHWHTQWSVAVLKVSRHFCSLSKAVCQKTLCSL